MEGCVTAYVFLFTSRHSRWTSCPCCVCSGRSCCPSACQCWKGVEWVRTSGQRSWAEALWSHTAHAEGSCCTSLHARCNAIPGGGGRGAINMIMSNWLYESFKCVWEHHLFIFIAMPMTQLYLSLNADNLNEVCLKDTWNWMTSSFLLLNSKLESLCWAVNIKEIPYLTTLDGITLTSTETPLLAVHHYY